MRYLLKFLNKIRIIKKVLSHDISRKFKQDILVSYFRCVLLNSFYSTSNRCSLLGYKFNYCVFSSFEYIFNEIFIDQEYSFHSDTSSPFIIDCGSNIGMSILYFKYLYPNASVIGFEPDKDAYDCLVSNIEENKLSSISLHNCALAEKSGEVQFQSDSNDPGSLINTTQSTTSNSMCVVKAEQLSGYIDKTVDFLKMDIEGAELEVIQELNDSGKLKLVNKMMIEYHHHMIDKSTDNLSVLLALLENADFGYQLDCEVARPFKSFDHQNMIIFAYKKK